MTPGSIGARLRAARDERGWSRRDLARQLRAVADEELPDPGSLADMVKQWENGKHLPTGRYRAHLARALEMDKAELFGPETAAEPSLWRPSGLNGTFTPDDEERLVLAARRPVRADAGVVESLGIILAAQRRTEDTVGAGLILEPVRAQLTAIADLVTEARGPIRPKVVDVAAQWAQFASWLHIATDNRRAAVALLDRTAEWAVEIDDMTMVGSVASWRSYLAEKAGQLGPMVGLAQAAQRYRSDSGRAYDMHMEARGHAMMRDVGAAERLLGEAGDIAADLGPADARPWEYYYLAPGYFDMERGLVLEFLGRINPRHNTPAAEAIEAGLLALPEGMREAEWTEPYREAMKAAQNRA